MPRFGLRFFLSKELTTATYHGYGPIENYIDKHHGSYHWEFTQKISEFYEDYIKPQEHGNRHDVDYVKVFGNDREVLVSSSRTFDCNISYYTQEEFTKKAHNFELEPSEYTILCIDQIGRASCR